MVFTATSSRTDVDLGIREKLERHNLVQHLQSWFSNSSVCLGARVFRSPPWMVERDQWHVRIYKNGTCEV